jgi:hypothetical protein
MAVELPERMVRPASPFYGQQDFGKLYAEALHEKYASNLFLPAS